MQALYAQLLVGLINGSFYALLSLGLAVIFGMLNIINFTHGAQYMLGAVTAWALCTWLLALLGMGGSVTSLPEDPALLQPLPQPARPLPERLGPLPRYAEIGRRPLFSENRRPQPFVINPDGEDDGKRGFDYVLTSVLIAPDFRMAILQPSEGGDSVRVRVGAAPDSSPGWRLVMLEPNLPVN